MFILWAQIIPKEKGKGGGEVEIIAIDTYCDLPSTFLWDKSTFNNHS